MNHYWQKSLQHPFRLFFPLISFAVLIALLPWLALSFLPSQAAHFPLHWHAFAFVHLTGGAAFAGFLLTALPEWTDDRRKLHAHSIRLLVLWGIALCGLWQLSIGAWLIVPFWVYLFALTASFVWRNKDSRQLSLLFCLSLIIALAIAYAANGEGRYLHAGVDAMLLAVAIINFRVARAIGNQALEDGGRLDERFIPNPYYKNLSCFWLAAATASGLAASHSVQGWLYLAAGTASVARLHDFHHLRLLRFAYVRAHYAVSLSLALGYSALGAVLLLAPAYSSFARHFLAIAVYLLMILTIISIAGQRHSGVKLHFHSDIRLALTLLLIAACARSIYSAFEPNINGIYRLPAVAIAVAFIVYCLRYLRIFARNEPR